MSIDWDINNLKGIELKNLLSLLITVGGKNDEIMNDIEDYIQEQKDFLLIQDMRELFWRQIPFELTSLKLGENVSPWDYQRDNIDDIEKKFFQLRLSDINLIIAIQNAIENNFSSIDRFGHGLNHEYGIFTTVALFKQNNMPIEIIACPKYGQPYNCINKISNTISAHKQLLLSEYFPDFRGSDTFKLDDYTIYYYTAVKGYPLSYLLKIKKCKETDPFFRYLCRKILLSFQQLLKMSTHVFSYPLNCDNIMISDEGITIMLGNINWDYEINPVTINTFKFLEERESKLVDSFGNIIKTILNTSNNSNNLQDKYIDDNNNIFTLPVHTDETPNPPFRLLICCGDIFSIRLPMPKGKEYKWVSPEIIIDEKSPTNLLELVL